MNANKQKLRQKNDIVKKLVGGGHFNIGLKVNMKQAF